MAAPQGWMNDPNGLCFHRDTWHAFFQHDPSRDTHGTMHWGHATSHDLLTWRHQPVALAPDELGMIYSGSVVIDHDDTAGFGPGAMVAVFTHHLDGVERQSIASSRDDGRTWVKYSGNPVLESPEPAFRDPKVRRREPDGWWVMALAVGRRIEFYESPDLRRWDKTGEFTHLIGAGVWECPDLVHVAPGRSHDGWMLLFGVVDGGPHGHSGTYGVVGDFDGVGFEPSASPVLLDHGPDFYAAQTFDGVTTPSPVVMGWMSSWRYAQTHPSRGRRGVLSLPRRLSSVGAGGDVAIGMRPAVGLASRSRRVHRGRRWESEPGQALIVEIEGEFSLTVGSGGQPCATVVAAEGVITLERLESVVDGYAETYAAEADTGSSHLVVLDHGTIEVFAAGGATTLSALVFAGPHWDVELDRPGTLTTLGSPATP